MLFRSWVGFIFQSTGSVRSGRAFVENSSAISVSIAESANLPHILLIYGPSLESPNARRAMVSDQNWLAPYRGTTPLSATLSIPGSKSVTNRALILASIASSASMLIKPLRSRDTELMMQGLRSLGIRIEEENSQSNDERWKITPAPLYGPASIEVGNAGTVMRFLPPLAALAQGLVNFDGDPRSHERQLGPVIQALES